MDDAQKKDEPQLPLQGLEAAARFPLPATFMTPDQWIDTGERTGTFSDGRWTKNERHEMALRKPGTQTPGSLEAIRELVASVIGQWIGVKIPPIQLFQHVDGPCALSTKVGRNVFTWGNVMVDPAGAILRPTAQESLKRYGGTVVLDALLGNGDRTNAGNHIFVEDNATWYTIDYSLSFNRNERSGIGDPSLPFAQTYFPEIIAGVREGPGPLRDSLARAEEIGNETIERLFALVPNGYASIEDKRAMMGFIQERRLKLHAILKAWSATVGLDEILNDA